jgi:hypothetical protein
MSQWAREHPELYDAGHTYLDAHTDLADMDDDTGRRCGICGHFHDPLHGCGCDAPGADKDEAA